MKNEKKITIGFADTSAGEDKTVVNDVPAPAQEKEPIICIAKVRLPGAGRSLDYYNDEFYLEPGDKVFVSGKFYGKLGVVESVTTHFRVDKTKYKKVIGKPDCKIFGKFIRIADKMVSFDTNFDAEKFSAIIIPPPDPEAETQEEIVCGTGWNIDLADFEDSEAVNPDKLRLAIDYCKKGNVIYLSLKDGKGAAFIRGSQIYKVEFNFDGETVSDLFCGCPFNDNCLCKHELAVLVTLRGLLGCSEFEDKSYFVAFYENFFWNYAAGEAKEIELK